MNKQNKRILSTLAAVALSLTSYTTISHADSGASEPIPSGTGVATLDHSYHSASIANNIREFQYDNGANVRPTSGIEKMPIRGAALTSNLPITGTISYHTGARVLTSVNIYTIYYGATSTYGSSCAPTPPALSDAAVLNPFLRSIGTSPWYATNTRYFQQIAGVTSFVSNAVNFPSANCTFINSATAGTGTSLAQTGTKSPQAIVDNVLAAKTFPTDPSALYFVFTDATVNVNGFNSGTKAFCGYHGFFTPTGAASAVQYSFVGNPGTTASALGGCAGQTTSSPNGNVQADAMASVTAHELVETVSDPQLNAWFDSAGNENGDKCAWVYGATTTIGGAASNVVIGGANYLVQQNWDPVLSNCYSAPLALPAFSASVTTSSVTLLGGAAGTAANITPVTAVGGSGGYNFSISPSLPAGLIFDPFTGNISGIASTILAPTAETVSVIDGRGGSITGLNFTLTINYPILSATVASATLNLAVGTSVPTNTIPVKGVGGSGVYTYTSAATLPAGLTLNPNTGAITGTPTVMLASPALETFTVTATVGGSITKTFSISIPQLSATVTSPTVSLLGGLLGTSANVTPVKATGGSGKYTYTISPALPTGLKLNSSTGAITGIAAGNLASPVTESVTVTATIGGSIAGLTFSLAINYPALTSSVVTSSVRLLVGINAAANTIPVKAAGGSGSFIYSIAPTLPAGFSFNSTTGAITGNSSSLVVPQLETATVTDSVTGGSKTNNFTLTVNAALAAALTPSTIQFKLGTASTSTVAPIVTGGYSPYTFALGSPPTGVTINAGSGLITYTVPKKNSVGLSATNYTVTVTDLAGYKTTYIVNIAIA